MKFSSHIWNFTKLISSFHFSLIKGGISGTLIPWSIDRECFFPTCKGGWQRPIRALGHWPWLWKTLLGGDLMRESLSCARIEETEQIHKGQLEADMWKERSNVACIVCVYYTYNIYIYICAYSMILHCTWNWVWIPITFVQGQHQRSGFVG